MKVFGIANLSGRCETKEVSFLLTFSIESVLSFMKGTSLLLNYNYKCERISVYKSSSLN